VAVTRRRAAHGEDATRPRLGRFRRGGGRRWLWRGGEWTGKRDVMRRSIALERMSRSRRRVTSLSSSAIGTWVELTTESQAGAS
jgi:hypothetical protein